MELFEAAVLVSTLLCALVAGLVLTFAIVVMPGIKDLGNLAYLKSFKAIDRVIQNNQPVFVLVWVGSAVLLLASTVWGIWELHGLNRALLVVACVIFIFGVHVPTILINIPLNNRLQSNNLDTMSGMELQETAELFQSRWLPSNTFRTIIATITTILLLFLLCRL